MQPISVTESVVGVLLADSNHMQCQLLASALRRRPEFRVTACTLDSEAILRIMASSPVEVVVVSPGHRNGQWPDMSIIRRLHLAHPQVAEILVLEAYDREVVVNAFRAGVKGLFCSTHPFRLLCKCIHSVHRGQVWANSEQMQFAIEGLSQLPPLRVLNARGMKLLTPREEQVVALVTDGLSNREIARDLALSEHTIKKYLFRIFDKLGISSRVELVLYAVSHGGFRPSESLAGAGA